MVPVLVVVILQFKLMQDSVSLRSLIRTFPEKKKNERASNVTSGLLDLR